MITATEQKLKDLRGIIREKADKLRLMYLAESDPESKRFLECQIGLLHAKHFSQDEINLSPPPGTIAQGEYGLGTVQSNGKPVSVFGLRERELPQHVIIAGRSGAGKSNVMLLLAQQFMEKQKPFLLFSFKREYRGLVGDTGPLLFTCGRRVADFKLNPLSVPKGTDRDTWINIIAEAISSVYFLGEGAISIIRRGLSDVYQSHAEPKLVHLQEWLGKIRTMSGREPDWLSSTKRAIDAMCFGSLGDTLNSDSPMDFEKLLDRQAILELDNFNDDDRTFIIQCIMRWVYRYALENFPRNSFLYSLMIDEAHHVFLKKSFDISGKETYSDQILRMVRECSVGVVLADQHPSLISLPALGNTFTTIGMNLKTSADVNAVGNAMLLTEDQKDHLGRLPCGAAIVKLQDRYVEPFMVRFPKAEIAGDVTDEWLRLNMEPSIAALSGVSSLPVSASVEFPVIPETDEIVPPEKAEPVESPESFGELEQAFLVSVLEHPFIGTSTRYRELQLSTRHGHELKDRLIDSGWLVPVDIHVHQNRMVLFELTDKSKDWLKSSGHVVREEKREGGVEHRFGVWYVQRSYRDAGYSTVREKRTLAGHFVDLVATKDAATIANEIETGSSDVLANVTACFSDQYSSVEVVATNEEALQKCRRELAGVSLKPGQSLRISYLLPDVVHVHESENHSFAGTVADS